MGTSSDGFLIRRPRNTSWIRHDSLRTAGGHSKPPPAGESCPHSPCVRRPAGGGGGGPGAAWPGMHRADNRAEGRPSACPPSMSTADSAARLPSRCDLWRPASTVYVRAPSRRIRFRA